MAAIGTRHPEHERFWQLAEPFLASGRLVEGTMMGRQCLRTAKGGAFVSTVTSSGDVVLKFSRRRVAELIEAGEGQPFAPAGKVFTEWVALAELDESTFEDLLHDSIRFVERGC